MWKNKKGFYKKKEKYLALLLVAPATIYLLVVMLFPFLWAIYISFTDKMVGMEGKFIGLTNYIEIIQDPIFLKALGNTLIFTTTAVIGKVILGVAMALVINQKIRARGMFRSLLILPWTIPTVISILTWQWMFSDVGGVLNRIMSDLGISDEPILWLSASGVAMFSVVLVNIWRGFPFVGISVLAGLQAIPGDYYEAASIDGANTFQKFWHITLPQIKGVITLATIVTTIWTLNDFEIVWLLTKGGPANSTNLISTYSYIVGFNNMDLGKAIAVSILFLPVMMLLINAFTKKNVMEE